MSENHEALCRQPSPAGNEVTGSARPWTTRSLRSRLVAAFEKQVDLRACLMEPARRPVIISRCRGERGATWRTFESWLYLIKPKVLQAKPLPTSKVEMPPLAGVNRETFLLHGGAQQIAMPAL